MLAEFRADLHVHTCLSPCASDEMLPSLIVSVALDRALDVIGICDHNASDNVAAVRGAAKGTALTVMGGMEITTREEVHILGLFDCDDALRAVAKTVEEHLPGSNAPDIFGEQWLVDAKGERVGDSERLLIGATELSVECVVELIHQAGGLAVASHIDRQAFGIIGQLGFIPPGLKLDALEISPAAPERYEFYLDEYGLPVVTSSDAHYPEDIGSRVTCFKCASLTVEELGKALRQEDDRQVSRE